MVSTADRGVLSLLGRGSLGRRLGLGCLVHLILIT